MKNFHKFALVFVLLLGLTACGSSKSGDSTGGDPATDLPTSVEAIGSLLNYARGIMDECFSVSPESIECDCPQSGTLTLTEGANDSGTFVFDNCVDSNAQLFNGNMSYEGNETTFNISRAAVCNDISSTANLEECTGTLEGTCGGTTSSCTFERSNGGCLCL